MGQYRVKGFLMLLVPERTFLFFSQTGYFGDGEDILAVELPPGLGQVLLTVMRWGEVRTRLANCTQRPQGRKAECFAPPPSQQGR